MNRFYKYATGQAVATERQMQQNTSQTRRHIEPIFDASGSLKRHAISRLNEAGLQKASEPSSNDDQGAS